MKNYKSLYETYVNLYKTHKCLYKMYEKTHEIRLLYYMLLYFRTLCYIFLVFSVAHIGPFWGRPPGHMAAQGT